MSWKSRFTFRGKRFVEHEVAGRQFRFYPNRMALLEEARQLSEPVAKAINILFADESRDSGSSVKRTSEGDFYVEDIQTDPVSQDMAKYRQSERERAISTLMGTLADKKAVVLLGRLFMDSLREEFPYDQHRSAGEVEEFLYGAPGDGEYQGLDLPDLFQLFQGWMKSNAQVFGDMGEKMVGLVRKRLDDLQHGSGSEGADPKEGPTNGSSSKKPSSMQLVEDSPPST